MSDSSHILAPLNDAQREAVRAYGVNCLVLAGAGTGKTRVLAHRIAWLIQVKCAAPGSILAITYAHNAAKVIRSQIEAMLQQPVKEMWVGTFHGLAHRFLRAHWQDAGLPQHFQILDAEDQQRLVKRLLKEMQLDESRYPPRQVTGFINAQKDEGRRPEHLDDGGDYFQRKLIEVYHEYQTACTRGGQVDFAELLLRTHELLRDRPDIRHHYQQRFAHILVDHFQDTSAIQYAWLRLLAGERDNLFLVGDDDQSIYGWRGAKVENMQRFQRDYPNTQVVRLEQNYRSTGTILKAANALIAHNPSRLGKNLWTQGGEGEPIQRYAAFNEVDEARFVVDRIRRYITEEGYRRTECAILYRTTAQSRLFEEALLQAQIPYRVYGGLRFFERAEIKVVLAYLRLLANPDDDMAFERAIATPPRNIGPTNFESLRDQSYRERTSLWRAARSLVSTGSLPMQTAEAFQEFFAFIDKYRAVVNQWPLETLTRDLLVAAGLVAYYRKLGDVGQDYEENLKILLQEIKLFRDEMGKYHNVPRVKDLDDFLAHAALEACDNPTDDSVQLMTLHSAKGMEFPIVFLVGAEEGILPHSLSIPDQSRLEEERRLCYVGLTRAKQRLFVCHAESRRFRGREEYPFPSRFLSEIPAELVEDVRAGGVSRSTPASRGRSAFPTSTAQRPTTATASRGEISAGGFHLGQRVLHPKFGEGVVLNSEGRGAAARIQINFQQAGTKWLVLAYAKLEPDL